MVDRSKINIDPDIFASALSANDFFQGYKTPKHIGRMQILMANRLKKLLRPWIIRGFGENQR